MVLILIALSLCLAANTYAANEALNLRHDPFQRPASFNNPVLGTTASQNTAPAALPRLRATLVAGEDSLVNVEGKIIGIGEVVDDYRLLSVDEGVAVFTKDDVQITLKIEQK